ncbi:hypothetical protein [Streptomyces leeuwenhoekii]|uniref:Gliding motility protein n=1 Tax=Streptomyces leeuwenhoekii TaxID=1437453 RepID=A0A0F7VS34_STRLW|nr:hypothetical protein [Streptomyces leeuwenhoekii]KMS80843.1 hypothetical protein ACH49_06100 [Streptomyces leeuwenhoekii]CQR61343.1 Hypothetical Protein sle_18810 [Streptomyces leeuwenhoekii]
MGVFARLLRRSKATGEPPAAEAQAAAPAPAQPEETAKRPDDTGAEQAAEPAVTEAAGETGSEGVDIPKQQSAGKAADNEAGEGARA